MTDYWNHPDYELGPIARTALRLRAAAEYLGAMPDDDKSLEAITPEQKDAWTARIFGGVVLLAGVGLVVVGREQAGALLLTHLAMFGAGWASGRYGSK